MVNAPAVGLCLSSITHFPFLLFKIFLPSTQPGISCRRACSGRLCFHWWVKHIIASDAACELDFNLYIDWWIIIWCKHHCKSFQGLHQTTVVKCHTAKVEMSHLWHIINMRQVTTWIMHRILRWSHLGVEHINRSCEGLFDTWIQIKDDDGKFCGW